MHKVLAMKRCYHPSAIIAQLWAITCSHKIVYGCCLGRALKLGEQRILATFGGGVLTLCTFGGCSLAEQMSNSLSIRGAHRRKPFRSNILTSWRFWGMQFSGKWLMETDRLTLVVIYCLWTNVGHICLPFILCPINLSWFSCYKTSPSIGNDFWYKGGQPSRKKTQRKTRVLYSR